MPTVTVRRTIPFGYLFAGRASAVAWTIKNAAGAVISAGTGTTFTTGTGAGVEDTLDGTGASVGLYGLSVAIDRADLPCTGTYTIPGTAGAVVRDDFGIEVLPLTSLSVKLAADGLDSVVIEAGINARQALSGCLAGAAGVVAGAEGTLVTIAGAGVATTRITASVDPYGNRTAVILSLPS